MILSFSDEQRKASKDGIFRGERNPRSLVTVEQVVEIRRRAQEGETQRALAGEFGLSNQAVAAIVNRVNWKHVP